jgi:hypothetical protein
MYRLSAKTRRIISTLAIKKVQHVATEWDLGDVPAVSAMMALKTYWETCPHYRPDWLDRMGQPQGKVRMKKHHVLVRILPEGAAPLPEILGVPREYEEEQAAPPPWTPEEDPALEVSSATPEKGLAKIQRAVAKVMRRSPVFIKDPTPAARNYHDGEEVMCDASLITNTVCQQCNASGCAACHQTGWVAKFAERVP